MQRRLNVFMHDRHITYVNHRISRHDREMINNHKSVLLWFTGLPGSGKSTISQSLIEYLYNNRIQSYVMDGDNIRHGLNKDLGFSSDERRENVRRIAETGKLFVDAGLVVAAALISPYRDDRACVRRLFEKGDFLEVYVKCSVDQCEKRDPKGLYKKARRGEITGFTGVDAPYEEPENPEITLDTEKYVVGECVLQIVEYLKKHNIIEQSL